MNEYIIPNPIIDKKEEDSLDKLLERYEKMISPGIIGKVGGKIGSVIPDGVKELGDGVKDRFSEQIEFKKAEEIISKGFDVLEKNAAKYSISEEAIIKAMNYIQSYNHYSSLDEICLSRGYDLAKISAQYKKNHLLAAVAEGGGLGVMGLPGIPFSIVFGTFLFYRAVQSIAMIYGYDVKNDSSELVIAGNVFASAMNPRKIYKNEYSNLITKVLVFGEGAAVKGAAKKGWAAMAEKGGLPLLLAQMRALAHKSAEKAVKQVGRKGLENHLFRNVFEEIGKQLTLKSIVKMVPAVSGVTGALFDVALMDQVIEFADVFYNKRFILEKEDRINILLDRSKPVAEYEIIDEE